MFRKTWLVLALTACTVAQQPPALPTTKDATTPVFELEESDRGEGITIDPILLLKGKQILPVPYPCEAGPALTQFTDEYLKPGTSYTVVFGGAASGTVTIKSPPPNSSDTLVRLNSAVPIHGLTMALAIRPSKVTDRKSARRDPTPAERKHAEELAKMILTDNGVNASIVARLRVDQVAVVEFVPGVPEIVASVAVETEDESGMQESLFFTAKTTSNDHSVIWYQHPQSETDAEAVYLVDFIDLDGDGVNELVARRVFYENYRYEVYKRQAGQWKRVFQTEVFGCL
jgi:hypothetical protein